MSITRAKFEDGQLNDCDITLKDLERINKTFVTILTGMYHSRIEYPEEAITGFKKAEAKKSPLPAPEKRPAKKAAVNREAAQTKESPVKKASKKAERSTKKNASRKKQKKGTKTGSGDNGTQQKQPKDDTQNDD